MTVKGDEDIKVSAGSFDDSDYDPVRLRAAHQAWVILITTCKGVAYGIVRVKVRAALLRERRRLTVDFYIMKMGLREHSRKFLLWVGQMVKELERVERPVDPKDVDIVILSDLSSQYDAEVRILENSSEWIERAAINKYERLYSEQSVAGSQVMLAGRGNGRNSTPSPLVALSAPAQVTRQRIARSTNPMDNRAGVAITVDATAITQAAATNAGVSRNTAAKREEHRPKTDPS